MRIHTKRNPRILHPRLNPKAINPKPASIRASPLQDVIEKKTLETISKAGRYKHVMNLGHGVMVGTPEENVAQFFEVARTAHERIEIPWRGPN